MSNGEEKATVKRSRVLVAALLAIVLVAGLYYVNRRWISPLGRQDLSRGGAHPLAPDFSLTLKAEVNNSPESAIITLNFLSSRNFLS